MTMMLIAGGIGAASGLINNNQKQAEYNRQKELAATLQQYSPWTGINALSYMPQGQPNAFDSILQGGLTGASFGNNLGMLSALSSKATPTDVAPTEDVSAGPDAVASKAGNYNLGNYAGKLGKQSKWADFEEPTLFNSDNRFMPRVASSSWLGDR